MISATVVGNLGRDAELKITHGGGTVLSFGVAAKGKTKEDGPIWVRCSLWGRRAEAVSGYLLKGTKVTAVGRLTQHEHNGKVYLELDVQELDFTSANGQSATGHRTQAPRARDEFENDGPGELPF